MCVVDGNLSYIDHCGHNLLIEFFPSDKNYSSASIYFNKPESGFWGDVAAIPATDGFLIFPLFSVAKSKSMHCVYQKAFAEQRVGVTIMADPYYKIAVSTKNDYFFTQPKYYAEHSQIDCRLIGNFLFLTIKSIHSYLYVFSLSDRIKLCYSEEIEDVYFTDRIEVIKKPVGATGCKTIEYYSVTDFSLTEKKTERVRSIYTLPRELIPCAFLEDLHRGGDFTEYLSRSLKPDNRLIAEFFGKFIFFIPYCFGDEIRASIVYADHIGTVTFSLTDDNTINDFSFI